MVCPRRSTCARMSVRFRARRTDPYESLDQGPPRVEACPGRGGARLTPPELVAAFEQAPRDHLRLDLGCALEDVEDAGVAEHARDRIFEREAVAAVDLERIVGRGPGDAG